LKGCRPPVEKAFASSKFSRLAHDLQDHQPLEETMGPKRQ
jgi:hypothetical protein